MPDIPAVWQPKQERQTPEVVQVARNALATLLQDVGVEHGRRKILMPEELLNSADIDAALKQVSGEGMAKGVGADGLRQTGPADRDLDGFDGFVDDAGIRMMTACDTSTRVY
jgi:hypothetical protein